MNITLTITKLPRQSVLVPALALWLCGLCGCQQTRTIQTSIQPARPHHNASACLPACTIKAPDGRVYDLTFAANGKRLAVTGPGCTRVWDTSTSHVLYTLQHPGDLAAITFSRDGNLLYLRTEHLVKTATDSRDHNFSYDIYAGAVRVCDAANGHLIHQIGFQGALPFVVELPDRRHIAVACDHRRFDSWIMNGVTVWLWDTQTWRQLYSADFNGDLDDVQASPDGRFLAVDVTLIKAATGKPVSELETDYHSQGIKHLVFSPDGRRLAGFQDDFVDPEDLGNLKLWSTDTGRSIPIFNGKGVKNIAFSSEGD